jgi:acyl-CoA synthetase (AMP-forming)/AMP-acid ligase II
MTHRSARRSVHHRLYRCTQATYSPVSNFWVATRDACIDDFFDYRALRTFIQVGFDLRKFGVSPGARCALLIPNSPELCVCLLACMNAYCAAPLNPYRYAHTLPCKNMYTERERN